MLKRALRAPAMQGFLAGVIGRYLAFALRTTRWEFDGWEDAAPHAEGKPAIVAFWHERLPMMPMLWMIARQRAPAGRHPMRAHALVSRHRDGRLIGDIMRRFRVDPVYGSSSRGGASGVRTLLALLEAGDHIAISPDGPRGPPRQAAAGVGQLAALSGVPILPCAAQTTRRRVLPSWDRMVLPLPFGRGVVVCEKPIPVPRKGWEAVLPMVAAALDRAAERADRHCAR